MTNLKSLIISVLVMLGLIVFSGMAHADKQKLVIQVSSADPQTQTLALNNAVNAQKSLGMDNVDIEVVAYGPGLSILTKQNQASQRVASLAIQDIRFSACGNTMAKIEQKTGKKPELTEGVEVVPGGVLRIMQLEQEGYAYIRP